MWTALVLGRLSAANVYLKLLYIYSQTHAKTIFNSRNFRRCERVVRLVNFPLNLQNHERTKKNKVDSTKFRRCMEPFVNLLVCKLCPNLDTKTEIKQSHGSEQNIISSTKRN